MKKKILLLIVLLLAFTTTACTKKDSIIFKKDYESLNGTTNSNGKEYRKVNIPKDNAIVISNAEEIVKMIENEETFYVYFGDKLCPWCRSVIEKAMEVANDNGISKIYYVEIWDDEGNEILRDKYELDENNNPRKIKYGTESYTKLLTYFDNVLSDYTYTLNDEEKSYGEKRIFAPNFIYVSKGKASRMTSGISELQDDPRAELTKEIIEDEERQFDDFFISVCDDAC